MMAKVRPLDFTAAILDQAHSMPRNGLRADGIVNTLLTNSSLFSLRDARVLNIAESSKLMGYDMGSLNLEGVTETQFRHMLGMSVHKGVAGLLLIGLLATLGGPV